MYNTETVQTFALGILRHLYVYLFFVFPKNEKVP